MRYCFVASLSCWDTDRRRKPTENYCVPVSQSFTTATQNTVNALCIQPEIRAWQLFAAAT